MPPSLSEKEGIATFEHLPTLTIDDSAAKANHPTIVHHGVELSRKDQRSMERTNSLSLLSGPARVNPGAKIPGEFRTLRFDGFFDDVLFNQSSQISSRSIHITDTKEGRPDRKGRKNVTDLSDQEWHLHSVLEICNRLGVLQQSGLDSPMAARRLARDGPNMITPPRNNILKKIFGYIFGGFGGLLLSGSVVSFISWKPLGEPSPSTANLALAVILLVVILLQTVFNAWQDYSTSRVMASIADMLPTDVLVTRDGSTFRIPAADLVTGDLVTITLGIKIPADLRLLEASSDLRFDRSILTGESNAIPGTVDATDPNYMETRNIALQGTLCTSGSGVGVCVAVGDNTVFGRIAKQAASERPGRTTLEIEIIRFVVIIGSLALVVAIIIIILWAAWLRPQHPQFISVPSLLVDCVSVAVAFIPESLPICVTLSLTVIAGAMRRSHILCKSLSTVESLGSVDIIASDKTGTLTQNKMTAVNIVLSDQRYAVSEALKLVEMGDPESPGIEALAAVAGLCNDASFEASTLTEPVEKRRIHGDATDTGLLRFSEMVSPTSVLRAGWKEAGKLAFNSKNKFAMKLFAMAPEHSSLGRIPALIPEMFGRSDYLLTVKGAPDVLLRRCTRILLPNGSLTPLNGEAMASICSIQEEFSSRGQRVILLAKRIISSAQIDQDASSDATKFEELLFGLNSDLTIVGLIALVDPPRHDTERTVRVCRQAGIRFAMVTGDFAVTAAAIARQVGILTNPDSEVQHIGDLRPDKPLHEIVDYDRTKEFGDPVSSLVISGQEMITMTRSQWKQAMAFDEIVFARTSPQQKLQIVRNLQNEGCTVAVTGDGVNDAPALKQADVGVAMAGGSEVAMEAADLILLTDFSAIITGIKYGRLCFENLRKTIMYLLPAGTFSELMPVVFNVLTGVPQALSSIQMILICSVTDMLPALSLVYEQPEADLLLRKPRNRKTDRLADVKLLIHAYFFIGVIQTLTSMTGAFYFGYQRNGVPFSELWLKYGGVDTNRSTLSELTKKAQSIYFFNLVITQWFNLLATRTRRLSIFQQNPLGGKKTRNIYLFPAMLFALALACFLSYVKWFQRIFDTRGVQVEFFFLPMAYGIFLLFLDESRKWWNRRHPTSWLARIAW